MPSPKTQPARGMRDFLPADVRKREYVISVIKSVYERYGFEPLETPAVENIETLMGKYGEEGNQLIFKILKRGEHEKTGAADLALRYDLTVPLARVVAQYQNELPKFFKRYQIQPVWRADRPARGRFREFYQCDVDVLGSKSMVVEAELIAAASDALAALGFNDFTVRLNHRQVLTGILDQAGVPREKHNDALISLDKMDKAGPEGVAHEFNERGIVGEGAIKLMRFFEGLAGIENAMQMVDLGEAASSRAAYNADVLGRLVEFIGAHESGARGVDDLRQILQFAKASGVDQRIKLDPTLARGLAYYTGAIIEINVADLAGSLGGGGRYDNLVGMFLGRDVAACGFSLGLERIIVVMSERDMFPKELVTSSADVMVTIWNEDSFGDSLALATELRNHGLRVDLYPEADKMGRQFKYASSRAIPFVAIIGDDERAKGEVAIKDMARGEQLRLPLGALGTLPKREQDSSESKPTAKPWSEEFLEWLRSEERVGEADDSIKPGA
ncbi:MAG TPA: histidine--tRNA ligase [Pyrinomonadaceae bacterium]|nr:histidine--tRNA ligase [Pyrinomonadaceae bacterium]